MSYYSIVKSNNVFLRGNDIVIDDIELLENSNPITNDDEFNDAINDAGYFLLSGGGTYIINERYLVVVQRAETALVNPLNISIFTGRSDSIEEILNPRMLLRELFEELLVYDSDGKLRYPKSLGFQDIIDQVYEEILSLGVFGAIKSERDLKLTYVKPKKRMCLGNDSFDLDFHVNSKRDINVLFLFDVHIDEFHEINFRDGEYHQEGDKNVFHNRDIMLLDLENETLCTQDGKEISKFDRSSASEHLVYLISALNKKENHENNC